MKLAQVLLPLPLLLLAAPVCADDHVELRKFIDARRSERGREEVELVLPARAPAVPARASLVWEAITYGHYAVLPHLVRLLPQADRNVRVLRVTNRPNRQAKTIAEFGGRTEVAPLDRARFDALVRDLLLIREAKLVRRKGRATGGRWGPLSHSPPAYWIARVALRSGAEPVLRLSGMMSRARSLVGGPLDDFTDAERLALCNDRIDAEIAKLPFERVPLPNAEARRLLREFAEERVLEDAWLDAVLMRMDLLASSGFAKASAELRLIEPWEKVLYRRARRALARIAYLSADDPKASLLAAMADAGNSDAAWAAAAARQVYPEEYRGWLDQRLASGDRSVLRRIRRLSMADAELDRRGLSRSDAGREAAAALTIWEITREPREIDVLVAIMRNKRLRAPPVRSEVLRILRKVRPGDARVGDALLMLAVDETDDSALRERAIEALRRYPGARTLRVLENLMRKAPSPTIAATLRALDAP